MHPTNWHATMGHISFEGSTMTITTIGIDLAKNVFAVHGVDHAGKTVLVKPRVSRAALPELIASLPPCAIGMEACSGAHYWARLFRTYGHEPRLMAPNLSPHIAWPANQGKTMRQMRKPSAKRSFVPRCVSCQSKMKGSRQCCVCIEPDRDSWKKKQPFITVFGD